MTLNTVDLWDKHFQSCKSAGMCKDQAERLSKAGYIPHLRQQEFHSVCRLADYKDGPTLILFGGARSGGKSHGAIAQAALDDCQRYDGLYVLFLRKLQRAAKESFNNLTSKALRHVNVVKSADKITFPNGSVILFGGFRTQDDIDKYVGIEYDEIIIEELTQIDEENFTKLRGSLRTGRMDNWRPRMYLTTNPGGIGHEWVKEKFILPYRAHQETDTRFIPSLSKDNPYTNPEYQVYLDSLTGDLRSIWRDGLWDLRDGRAFPTFGQAHIIDSFDPLSQTDREWMLYRGIDFGGTAPYCCLWVAVHITSGRVIIYREDYSDKLSPGQQAERIKAKTPPGENIIMTFCDPSMFAKQYTDTGVTSTVDLYADHGLTLSRGDNGRVNGKRKIDNLLTNKPDGKPGMYIVKDCKHIIDQMNNLLLDDRNKEDVNTKMEDHAFDAFKYSISTVHDVIIRDRKAEQIKRRPTIMSYFPG